MMQILIINIKPSDFKVFAGTARASNGSFCSGFAKTNTKPSVLGTNSYFPPTRHPSQNHVVSSFHYLNEILS